MHGEEQGHLGVVVHLLLHPLQQVPLQFVILSCLAFYSLLSLFYFLFLSPCDCLAPLITVARATQKLQLRAAGGGRERRECIARGGEEKEMLNPFPARL